MELCNWVYWDKYFGRGAIAVLGLNVEGDCLVVYDFDWIYGAGYTGRIIRAIIWRKKRSWEKTDER